MRRTRSGSAVLRCGALLFSFGLCDCGGRDIGDGLPPGKQLLPGVSPTWDKVGSPCNAQLGCRSQDLCVPLLCQNNLCVASAPLDCDDTDECTSDSCDPIRGECKNEPRTPDLDGDGYRAPLLGMLASNSSSCGNDCDDTQPSAHPGGEEVCDGADNDCNGVADEGFSYAGTGPKTVVLSSGNKSGLGGLAYAPSRFAVSLSYNEGHDQNRITGLDDAAEVLFESDLALVNSDTFAGPLLWTGSWFATAWEDRRDDDYEIYFNRIDRDGNKLGPDQRVTQAPDFSLNPTLVFTGSEHILAWADRRLGRGTTHIFGQRLGLDGELLLAADVDLTPYTTSAEGPVLALGQSALGLVYTLQDAPLGLAFRSVAFDLSSLGEEHLLTRDGASSASLIAVGDRYVVIWEQYLKAPGDAIWGAVLNASGEILIGPQKLTVPAAFARSHSVLSLGDRLLLFWAESSGGAYAIYMRSLDTELNPLSDASEVVRADEDALGPSAAFGVGALGLAYTQYVEGSPQVYFKQLLCSQ